MLKKIKEWFYWNGDMFFPIVGFIVALAAIILGLGLMQANMYKFNCKLDHRPDLYTAWFIADSTYAYDPEFFCNHLKQEMNK